METENSISGTSVEALLSPDQAAAALGVRRRTLEDWVRAGKIPVVKLGRLHKFRPATLQQFIETQETLVTTRNKPVQIETSVPSDLEKAAVQDAAKRQRQIALLEQWNAEDATDDPQEIARREAEWGAFEKSLEANRLALPVSEV